MRFGKNKRVRLLHAILLMLMVFSVWGTAQAAFLEITGDPLRIQADEYSTMAVFRWNVQQYYGIDAKGSVLFLNGSDSAFRYGGGASTFTMYTSNVDRFTPVSHAKINDWTINTVYNAGATGVQIEQTVSYINNSAYYQIKWVITNNGNQTYNDVRWIHGGDTYFAGDDSSEGHWNDSQGMVYLKNETMGISGIMGLYGGSGSRASHYYEDIYYYVAEASRAGQLLDTVNTSYLDSGYALQWNRPTLGPGEIWTIIAFEKWTEAGYVQVVAPAGKEGSPGQTVTYLFSVQNYQANQDTFNLQVTSSGGWAVNLPGGNTVIVAANGDQTVTVEVVVPPGASGGTTDTLTLTATSQTNTAVSNSDSTITTVAAVSGDVTVNFIADSGGSITGELSQTITSGGDCSPVMAYAYPGYKFRNWQDTNGNIWYDNPLTLTNVTSDLTVTAVFSLESYEVQFIAGTGGYINGNAYQILGYDGNCTAVRAVPADGYEFTGWTGDYTGLTNPLIITHVTSNKTITANFKPVTYTVTFAPGIGGSISGSTSQTVNRGADCTAVTAVPEEGYDFAGWSGGYTGTDNPLTIMNVTANLSITANFKKKTFIVNAIAETGGSISGVTGSVSYGDTVTLTATPAEDYVFTGWTGDFTGTNNPLIISSVTSNINVTAHFSLKPYTVSFIAGPGGSLIGNSSQTVPLGGNSSPVKAVPDPGYDFSGWSGGYTGMTNPLTITNVQSDIMVTANFKKIEGNLPPDKPILESATGDAILPAGEPIKLEASPYSDPEKDAQTASWWQVHRFNDPELIVDEKTVLRLNSYTITSGLEPGVKYVWRVAYQDSGSGEFVWSDDGTFLVGSTEVDKNIPPVISGVQLQDYKMVSFDQWPEDPSAVAVFGSMIGTEYNDEEFIIGTYDPNSGAGGYLLYPDFNVEPGHSYWFLSRHDLNFAIEGIPVSKSVDFCMELKFNSVNRNGWNMIAPPNNANYHWGDLEVMEKDSSGNNIFGPIPISQLPADNEYTDIRIWEWDAGAYSPTSDADFLLKKYAGYWVLAKKSNVYLNFPSDAQIAQISPAVMIAAWMKDIKDRAGEKIFGVDSAYANISLDSPPMPMGGLGGGSSGAGLGCFISVVNDE